MDGFLNMIYRLKTLTIIALSLAFFGFSSAHAERSADFGAGSVVIGDSTTPCAPGIAGALRYKSGVGVQLCDGATWDLPTGGGGGFTPCTIGDAVGDGICAGTWMGANLIAAPKGCSNNATSAGDCSGSDDSAEWGYNGWPYTAWSIVDMVPPNEDYFDLATTYAVDVSGKAPAICSTMSIDGETWYLPTIGQLGVLYDNKDTGSWTDGAFVSNEYWSINLLDDNNAYTFNFANGRMEQENNEYSNKYIRCVRVE